MAEKIKLKSTEIALTTANTISGASIVRIYASANALITLANTGGTIGTCTVAGGTVEYFIKQVSDTLASNVSVLATKVAYT